MKKGYTIEDEKTRKIREATDPQQTTMGEEGDRQSGSESSPKALIRG